MGFNEKTVRKYHDKFLEYKGKFVDEESGKYKKQCLMNDENFRLQVSMWVRENAYQKGEVNTSAKYFCEWVNSDLLPNPDFPSNMPCTIKLRTTISWLHRLGY